ncbi:MBL fold metallo-hydrolase [Carboxylicivirga marina]|uniref:MBL fold metallo-hydrolase n=1 Tax=Carboxylicivirga marina TaxID=2800988 RepID=A0ABS1HFJ2_9BACT|nr:MBL fold metallo-hydrolase [Carboxylicivirga marina]MBK3516337.1 MBL fold metallo-hydrolase [Carboxylicivirga marina]
MHTTRSKIYTAAHKTPTTFVMVNNEMDMRKRKKTMIIIVSILCTIILPVVAFMALSPQFGGTATKTIQNTYSQSPQYRNGKFANIGDVKMEMSGSKFWALIKEQFNTHPNATPKKTPQIVQMDSSNMAEYNGDMRLFWFGHSSFLIQTNGKNILIDPMLGQSASPVPFVGVKRFNKQLPIDIEKLPKIDLIIISHDHYDHLDYGSITRLKDKTEAFYTPLGVGSHLVSWGVDKHRISELDWWQEIKLDKLTLACTPAQHFSGRGKWFNDQASTLWCSWVIKTPEKNIFFSGDSGYGQHFKTIGEKYGPFDLALMECGQYNELWKEIHMMPEETIQAGKDVQASVVMPIHWGGFKLAMHDWLEPITRASIAANKLEVKIISPQIGEGIILNGETPVTVKWWEASNRNLIIDINAVAKD